MLVNRRFGRTIFATLFLTVVGTSSFGQAQESPSPVRLDPDKMAGLNLTSIPPDA